MGKKVLLGGILAGVVMFVWSSIAHIATPIGEMGVKSTPNEAAVLAALKANIQEPGFYFMPGEDMMRSKNMSKENQEAAQKTWEAKYRTGPLAIMVYHPYGKEQMVPKQLVYEFLSDIVAGIIFAWTLWMAAGRLTSFGGRTLFVFLLGTLPFIVSDFSYWNWYDFPVDYECAQMLDQWIAGLFAALFLAWFYRKD